VILPLGNHVLSPPLHLLQTSLLVKGLLPLVWPLEFNSHGLVTSLSACGLSLKCATHTISLSFEVRSIIATDALNLLFLLLSPTIDLLPLTHPKFRLLLDSRDQLHLRITTPIRHRPGSSITFHNRIRS
jgi:hypothetical protein